MTHDPSPGARVAVLEAAGRSLSLMWRHVGVAIGLTVTVVVPVEWLLRMAGLRGGTPDVDPLRFVLATLVSLAAGLWVAAAFLRVIDGRERGVATLWPWALFESLDAVPWLCLNMVAVAVAVAIATVLAVAVVGLVAVVAVTPSGLSALFEGGASVGAILLLAVVAAGMGLAVWIGSLMVRWVLVTPVVVLEGRHWGLERSSQLTRGNRWRCFGVMTVVGTVLTVLVGVIGGVGFAIRGGGGQALPAVLTGGDLAVQVAFGFSGLLFTATYYVLMADLCSGGAGAAVTVPSDATEVVEPASVAPVPPPAADGGSEERPVPRDGD